MAMIKMQTIVRKMAGRLRESVRKEIWGETFRSFFFFSKENFCKLCETHKDLTGGGPEEDSVAKPGRQFVREGCLQKLSRKGYQQRMFVLFTDALIYANRASSSNIGQGVHFRIHGRLRARDLSVLDSEPRMGAEHCFNVYDGQRALLVAATSREEKALWMEDIAETAQVY